MAWTFTTRQICMDYSGLAEGDFKDAWSNWIEKLISDREGIEYIGTTATVSSEKHDGDGTDALFVKNPPVVSVTSMTISDASVNAADYKVYEWGVRLVSSAGTELETAMEVTPKFPVGVQNVSITYVSGRAAVSGRIEMMATLMICEIAKVASREGSDASIKYSEVTDEMGKTPVVFNVGLHAKIMAILNRLGHKRIRAR